MFDYIFLPGPFSFLLALVALLGFANVFTSILILLLGALLSFSFSVGYCSLLGLVVCFWTFHIWSLLDLLRCVLS